MCRKFIKNCLIVFLLILTGCNQYGIGGKNACLFVKERFPQLREYYKDVAVIEEDSSLTCLLLSSRSLLLSKELNAFLKGEINKEEFSEIINDIDTLIDDVCYSWNFPHIVNDSLKQLSKYDDMWRKVYTVEVIMKSGITKKTKVLMDRDGKTPWMVECDVVKETEELLNHISEAKDYILMY